MSDDSFLNALVARFAEDARELGEAYGVDYGNQLDMGTDAASWSRWTDFVSDADDDEDKAMRQHDMIFLGGEAASEIGESCVSAFNKAWFTAVVDRVRERLSE